MSMGDATRNARALPLFSSQASLRSLMTAASGRRGFDSFLDMPPLVPAGAAGVPSSSMPSRETRRGARTSRIRTTPKSPPESLPVSSKKRVRTPPTRSSKRLKKPPPESAEDLDLDRKPSAISTCTVCMCESESYEVSSIDGCEHRFCFDCISKWAERENSCPNCKNRFTRIKRLNPQRRKKGQKSPVRNSKKVKRRNQRSDILPGAELEHLLASLAATNAVAAPTRGGVNIRHLVVSHLRAPHFMQQAVFPPPPPFAAEDHDDMPVVGLFPPILDTLLHHHRVVVQPHSHAVNANDSTAGGFHNPLEIVDEDDDEVEVVRVRTRSSTASL